MPSNVAVSVGQTAQFNWAAENFVGFPILFLTPPVWISSNPLRSRLRAM
jgi:hypothetical protein